MAQCLQVAKDGTFSAAAKHLYISQPSLSQCIKKVETELGVRLFDRSQTPLALTTAGEIYVRQAKEILRIRQALVQEVADLSELRTGSLTIGSSRTRSACFLIDPLVAFHRQYPGIQLAIKEAPVRTLEEYAAAGTVDFALLYDSSMRADFDSVELCRERTMLALPKSHPLASERRRSPSVKMPSRRSIGSPISTITNNSFLHGNSSRANAYPVSDDKTSTHSVIQPDTIKLFFNQPNTAELSKIFR